MAEDQMEWVSWETDDAKSDWTLTAKGNETEKSRDAFLTIGDGGEPRNAAVIKITQEAGAKSYGEVSVELSYPTIPAAGGKADPALSYSQEWGWNGGTSGGGTATSGGKATYGGAGVDPATGEVTAEANEGEARDVATATVEVALNGKTGTATATVRQEGAGS